MLSPGQRAATLTDLLIQRSHSRIIGVDEARNRGADSRRVARNRNRGRLAGGSLLEQVDGDTGRQRHSARTTLDGLGGAAQAAHVVSGRRTGGQRIEEILRAVVQLDGISRQIGAADDQTGTRSRC